MLWMERRFENGRMTVLKHRPITKNHATGWRQTGYRSLRRWNGGYAFP